MAEPPQAPDRVDFFISYASVDRHWAEWIDGQLQAAGYSTRLDVRDFAPGTSFLQGMEAAMAQARHTLAVLTPDYLTANYTRIELESAVIDDPTGVLGTLLPVRVRAVVLPNWLQRLIYIDLVGLEEAAAAQALLAGISGEAPEAGGSFPGNAADQPTARFPGALPPIWNVPHGRNPNFTGRSDLLSRLHDALHAGQATVLRQALRGLGGVGKTQLALEYAYRHAADYSVVWWVPSETSPATVYAELSRELGLPEAAASESEVRVQAVRRWLERHGGWLLVFDNAVEPEAVRPYLPQGGSGHVIITSRYWDWGEVASGLGVEVFDRDTESVPFLLQRTSQADEAAAKRLADALGNLPLALAQAAAYIASTGIALANYVELFESRRAELWEHEEAPGDYPEPVGTAWSLAMDKMRQEMPAAAELLYLLAYLSPDAVPHDLLLKGSQHLPKRQREMLRDSLSWNQSLQVYRRYGMVEVSEKGLVMHRLVQAVTQDRLSIAKLSFWYCLWQWLPSRWRPLDPRLRWASVAVKVIEAAFPVDTYNPQDISRWAICLALLKHALVSAGHAETLAVSLRVTGSLLHRVVLYLQSQGCYEVSEPIAVRALRICEKISGRYRFSQNYVQS